MSKEKFDLNTIKTQEVDEINGITRDSTQQLMTSAKISSANIASYSNENMSTMSIPSKQGVNSTFMASETVFGVASLSKPVFAYLVLKLIETNKTNAAKPGLGKFNTEFDLETPLYKVFQDKTGKTLSDDENPFLKKFVPEQREWAKQLNAKMVLSHRTGLHIIDKEPFKFQFEPGTHYAYSGPGIHCLQGVIEELTDKPGLETLAQENIFGPLALNMPHSTYGAEPDAANSLKTTAAEYAKFITSWINDDKLNYAFKPIEPTYSMKEDYFPSSEDKLVEEVKVREGCDLLRLSILPENTNSFQRDAVILFNEKLYDVNPNKKELTEIPKNDKNAAEYEEICSFLSNNGTESPQPASPNNLKKIILLTGRTFDDRALVTWGLGIGLVQNDEGKIIGAYHTGDMNEWRAGFGAQINPETNRCTTASVYCANSHNGHVLAEHFLPKTLEPALNYFFPTYGFAQNVKELDGTDFHGLNPNLLKPNLKKMAYETLPTHHYKEELQKTKSEGNSQTGPSSSQEENKNSYTPLSIKPKPSGEL